MSWWAIILVIPYSVGQLVCARLIAGHLAWKWQDHYHWARSREPDTAQWFGAFLCGLVLGVVWPLVWLRRRLPWERFAIGAEAEVVRRERAKRIAEFERGEGWR